MSIRSVKTLLVLGDVLVFYSSIYAALFLRHMQEPDLTLLLLHIYYFTPLIALWILVFYLSGLYSRQVFLFADKTIQTLFLAQFVNVFVVALSFFFVFNTVIAPKLLLAIYLLVSVLFLFVWRMLIAPDLFKNLQINIIDLSTQKLAKDFSFELAKVGKLNFTINIQHKDLFELKQKPFKLQPLISNSLFLVDERGFVPIINLSAYVKQMSKLSLVSLEELYSFVGKVPKAAWSNFLEKLFAPDTALKRKVLERIKRIYDLALLFAVFPVAAVVFVVLALLVYFIEGKPVFYVSLRKGFEGKEFKLYKFRTMTGTDSGEEAKNSKLSVTRLGQILRKLRLDELPQLWNIFRGDLSFVGPRPEIVELAQEYEKEIPEYLLRYLVRPGLTGWAQIMQKNHPHHQIDIEATKEKLEYDLYYIKNENIFLDMQIMLQTILIVLGLKGK